MGISAAFTHMSNRSQLHHRTEGVALPGADHESVNDARCGASDKSAPGESLPVDRHVGMRRQRRRTGARAAAQPRDFAGQRRAGRTGSAEGEPSDKLGSDMSRTVGGCTECDWHVMSA